MVFCKPQDAGKSIKSRTRVFLHHARTTVNTDTIILTEHADTHIHTPQSLVMLFFIPHALKACWVEEGAAHVSRTLLLFHGFSRVFQERSNHMMFVKGWLLFLFRQLMVHGLVTTQQSRNLSLCEPSSGQWG